ncbi:hypothetical protein C5B42_00970 [Candidatus Cerribacteria bacterium 'Amazon FNV 2010 28 9']|uniref:Uncharacterized protein n=1 Tax=Candidatus Cerribacteria bacterium 'Amazon FNV 2010 28 9' TaxID=2081795 RepID=A0A317JR89_9BACT|nr:MAG: hypothetical protein C5B42_00970 [Candidatus Cerribacteria bacterium 'Amazon FNV 2010 28 9']
MSVIGIYEHAHFIPKKFRWRDRVYLIQEITLVSDIRDGLIKKRMYSVLCNKTLYRLLFNRETEDWKLEEVWVE